MNLLPAPYIAAQLQIVRRSASARALTAALIALADWLDSSRRDPAMTLSAADGATLDEVVAALQPRRQLLAERMQRRAILATEFDEIIPERFVEALSFSEGSAHWKPQGAMWTSPTVSPVTSAWTLRTETGHDAAAHAHILPLDAPEVTLLVDSLESADDLAARHHDSGTGMWRSLHRDGVWRVDFSWLTVLEAEVDAFRGRRRSTAFPCGLGVESSLWLRVPDSQPSGVGIARGPADVATRGWFTYR
jgi:hypothetical protein